MDVGFVFLLCCFWTGVLTAPANKWVRYREKFYLEFTDDQLFDPIDTYCRGMSPPARIVNIQDADENAFVAAFNGGREMWIGVTKASGNWVDWQGHVISYANWAPAQPDNSPPSDAVIINYPSAGQWDDIDSTSTSYMSVCELDMTAGNAVFNQLVSSAGAETAILEKYANRRIDCATSCMQQIDCSCFGYDVASKTCSVFKWQPTMQPNVDYFCFREIIV